jgi:hypothetical protein
MRAVGLAALVLLVAAGASAQSAYMSAPEARRIFYGIDMQGRHEPSKETWRECITPDGKTSYWFRGAVDEGRLVLKREGELCFSYASSGYRSESCWRARRLTASTYRFESTNPDDGVFITTATRPAQSCPGRETPMS